MNENVCEVCGADSAIKTMTFTEVEYHGEVCDVPHHLTSCGVCGSEFADVNDLLLNKRAMIAARKDIDGIPSGEEIRALRVSNGLTQKVASEIFGGGPVAFSKYETDDLIPSEAMCLLIKMAIKFPDTVDKAASIKGVVFNRPKLLEKRQRLELVGKPVSVTLETEGYQSENNYRTAQSSAKDIYLGGSQWKN